MHTSSTERTLTELDHVRLLNLLRRHTGFALAGSRSEPCADDVAGILETADLVAPQRVAPDVVTMHSQVLIREVASGRRRTLIVCYPQDARPADGFVSILSPVGASLLGLRAGDVARWRSPLGGTEEAEVLAVLFQPEAHGDFSS